jgi:PAS domain S-box-containing protein
VTPADSLDFRVVADAMPIPVVISRISDGLLLYCNALMTRAFGLAPEDIGVKRSTDFYADPGQRERLIAMLRASPGRPVQFEMEAPPAPGRPRWVTLTAQRILFDGEPAILVSMVDITERRRAEESLRASEELYRVLFESSPLPTWVAAKDTLEFLTVNDAAVRHYGYSREEFLAMTPRALRPLEDLPILEAQIEHTLREARPLVHPARHRKKDGSIIQVEITAAPIRFRDRAAFMAIINDVSERLRLEEELERARKLESLGRLAGGVAHDFNNFLTAILGYTQLLERRFAADPDALADLDEVRAAGSQARDLTQQLLTVARRQTSLPSVVDLNVLLVDMQRLVRRLVGEGVELVYRLATDPWPIKVDRSQVEQVLINLAVNARDAMNGKGRLEIRTENRCVGPEEARGRPGLEPGDYVSLQVIDSGIGMAPEVLAHVFEPFFTTKPSGEGTGLGLATVYAIVSQSGGRVWVESDPGRGTTFTLCFPRSADPVRAADFTRVTEARGGRESILVVEDNTAVRSLAVRVLEGAGYRVRTAPTGPVALEQAAGDEAAIDLLVTDVVMPGMSGRVMAEQLTRLRPGLKVLYVSGYSQDTMSQHGALGPNEQFLAKPFTGPDLLLRVRELLDRRDSVPSV